MPEQCELFDAFMDTFFSAKRTDPDLVAFLRGDIERLLKDDQELSSETAEAFAREVAGALPKGEADVRAFCRALIELSLQLRASSTGLGDSTSLKSLRLEDAGGVVWGTSSVPRARPRGNDGGASAPPGGDATCVKPSILPDDSAATGETEARLEFLIEAYPQFSRSAVRKAFEEAGCDVSRTLQTLGEEDTVVAGGTGPSPSAVEPPVPSDAPPKGGAGPFAPTGRMPTSLASSAQGGAARVHALTFLGEIYPQFGPETIVRAYDDAEADLGAATAILEGDNEAGFGIIREPNEAGFGLVGGRKEGGGRRGQTGGSLSSCSPSMPAPRTPRPPPAAPKERRGLAPNALAATAAVPGLHSYGAAAAGAGREEALRFLYEAYPQYSKTLLERVLQAAKGDLASTVRMLEDDEEGEQDCTLVPEPEPLVSAAPQQPRGRYAQAASSPTPGRGQAGGGAVHGARAEGAVRPHSTPAPAPSSRLDWRRTDGMRWFETGKDVQEAYAGQRTRAAKLSERRQLLLRDATRAYQAGHAALASDLARQGRQLGEELRRANEEASTSIFETRNPHLRRELCQNDVIMTVDLHGLHVSEALRRTNETIEAARAAGHPALRLVVGLGTHSRAAAKIPSAVRAELEREGVRYTEPFPGTIQLRLTR